MKEIDFKYVEDIWRNNQYPLGIYIHSPYCRSICSYCAYKGNLIDEGFDRYFNEVLPESIRKYRPIIDANKVRSIYFGGGTPNFNSDMKNLIPALEMLKDVRCVEKAIELHMGIPITDETVDMVKRYGFNTVILCQQTFNENLLRKHNRVVTSENDMAEIVRKFHSFGIRCGSDFLYFEDEPIDALIKDMEISVDANLDEITIAPIYRNRTEISRREFLKIYELFNNDGRYVSDTSEKDLNDTQWAGLKTFRWVKRSLFQDFKGFGRFYSFVLALDDSIASYPTYTSVLGIGSFNNKVKKTYSNVNNQWFYCEDFDGNDTHYYLIKEKSFYDKMREVIDWAESCSVEPPPSGVSFSFQNTDMSGCNGDYDGIGLSYSIDLPMVEKSRYIDNLIKNKPRLTSKLKEI